jgi:hypothetical protein
MTMSAPELDVSGKQVTEIRGVASKGGKYDQAQRIFCFYRHQPAGQL